MLKISVDVKAFRDGDFLGQCQTRLEERARSKLLAEQIVPLGLSSYLGQSALRAEGMRNVMKRAGD